MLDFSISERAAAFRLGIDTAQVPQGLTFYLYSPTHSDFYYGPYSADDLTEDEIFWSPVIEGEMVRVELYAETPATLAVADLGIKYVSVLHDSVMSRQWKRQSEVGSAQACNVNVACDSKALELASTTAKYVITDFFGRSYLCTGVLLNDTRGSGEPWFITAEHCISGGAKPSSMQFYWNFRTQTCNGSTGASFRTSTGGATRLYRSTSDDVAFLKLNKQPPTTARAGWKDSTPALNIPVLGIHHPGGDYQKLSKGTLVDSVNWRSFSFKGTHWEVQWNSGVTEPGSSGSGLFNASNELLGVLSAGRASCSNPMSVYSRFDRQITYLKKWLDPVVIISTPVSTGSRVKVKGKVSVGSSTPVCGLVLINGQHAFTCNGSGSYELDVPVDGNGKVAIQFFADGLEPLSRTFSPTSTTVTQDLTVTHANRHSPVVSVNEISALDGNRARLRGRVTSAQGAPMCSMVLANGAHAFTCQGDGTFDLNVPRAADGSVTLFGFSHGLSPSRQVFSQF
ncbi:trypsin-like serine peptidase [Nitrincola sp. MINF-07-Sa-05]|uniref:trypsin-like serine peptidase n=1 Tax=Nitrincola salilacus TaxID=3400273 RepID=UPI0039181098